MIKIFTTITFAILSICASAQNYQCLQPGVKRYYEGKCLRGIRIDSVITTGNETAFYLFRSYRGATNIGVPQLDTNGGSWMGKKVVALQDGTTLFDNLWGDTVVVKTQAALNDSWIFYNDTSSRYYTATVTSIDTMTLLGVLDSVKTMTITAYNQTGVNASDSMHQKQMILSKEHGFASVFSLYGFPFHPASMTHYQMQLDYLIDMGDIDYDVLSTYRLIDYRNPTGFELFEANVGDIFQYEFMTTPNYTEWYTDTIVSKIIVSPTQTQYNIHRVNKKLVPVSPNTPGYTLTYQTMSKTVLADTVYFVDSTLMPEETGFPKVLRYRKNDTGYCANSFFYDIRPTYVFSDGYLNNFEPCGQAFDYKAGLDIVERTICIDASGVGYYEYLKFYKKGNIPCGSYMPMIVSVEEMAMNVIKLFPIPATDNLTIELPGSAHITVTNLIGAQIWQGEINGSATINTTTWANGMYLLSVRNENGEWLTKKFVVSK